MGRSKPSLFSNPKPSMHRGLIRTSTICKTFQEILRPQPHTTWSIYRREYTYTLMKLFSRNQPFCKRIKITNRVNLTVCRKCWTTWLVTMYTTIWEHMKQAFLISEQLNNENLGDWKTTCNINLHNRAGLVSS
jgi:hypothetical protein